MTIGLSPDDFDKVVGVLSAMPNFQTVGDRVSFLTDVFAGAGSGMAVLTSLDVDGTPRAVAVRVVHRLQQYGQDEPGREALGVLINKMLAYRGGGEPARDLRSIMARYPFITEPVAEPPPVSAWTTPGVTAEKIIGENTLRDLYVLELALQAARAVVHIERPGAMGTGFMISPDLLITNHHVIKDTWEAARATFTFNYQIDRTRTATPATSASARVGGAFYSDVGLDVTVCEIEMPDVAFEPLVLRPEIAVRNKRVAIIQHPGGHYKKISMQNNFVAYADAREIRYTTSTEPGSSGSPVFNDMFEVIGVHRAGGPFTDPETGQQQVRNQGMSAIAILDDLAGNAPEIRARLAG
jgi:S1-C subfamily serine protease